MAIEQIAPHLDLFRGEKRAVQMTIHDAVMEAHTTGSCSRWNCSRVSNDWLQERDTPGTIFTGTEDDRSC